MLVVEVQGARASNQEPKKSQRSENAEGDKDRERPAVIIAGNLRPAVHGIMIPGREILSQEKFRGIQLITFPQE